MEILKAERDYMSWTEEARTKTKYSLAEAQLIKDIIDNGETFSREKWESIYKNKEVPWRKNKILQEVMVRTKGFPNDLCEKILSCAFNKKIYKAALSRDDISTKNIDIVLSSMSERNLALAFKEGAFSTTVANRIATKLINKTIYDPTFTPNQYELLALSQTNISDTIKKNFLPQFGFEELSPEILTAIVNNINLDDETRNIAFDLGCDPYSITAPYTKHMEEVVIDGMLYRCTEDLDNFAADFIKKAIMKNQISKDKELEIIKEIKKMEDEKGASVMLYISNPILSQLFINTKHTDVLDTGLSVFPRFSDAIISNKNIVDDIPNCDINKTVCQLISSTIAATAYDSSKVQKQFIEKIETSWKDKKFNDEVYSEVEKFATKNNNVPNKMNLLLAFVCSSTIPDKTLKNIIDSEPADAVYSYSSLVTKIIATQNLSLREKKLPFMVGEVNISTYLNDIGKVVNGFASLRNIKEYSYNLASQPQFLESGDKYIENIKEVAKIFNNTYFPNYPPSYFKTLSETYQKVIEALEEELKIQSAINKDPSKCNREEIELAKSYCLSHANTDINNDPITFILNFEDKKSYYLALCQQEHELDIKEGKIDPTTLVEEIFDDSSSLIATVPTNSTSSPRISKTEEIFEI